MIVKPHPGAVLPLAITVKIAREVLAESRLRPERRRRWSSHDAGDSTAQTLALRPEVKIVDFTGSTANGRWLEEHARQAQVYTEKAGRQPDRRRLRLADFKGLVRNVAFSLSLYTGQMCTAPQNLYVPKDGIDTAEGHLTFDQVAAGLAEGVSKLLGRSRARRRSPGRRAKRRRAAAARSRALARRRRARHAARSSIRAFPEATVRTPLIVKLHADDRATYLNEMVRADRVRDRHRINRAKPAVSRATRSSATARSRWRFIRRATTSSTQAIAVAGRRRRRAVDQPDRRRVSSISPRRSRISTATGANPAANAALTDAAYVASRVSRRAASDACLVRNQESRNQRTFA